MSRETRPTVLFTSVLAALTVWLPAAAAGQPTPQQQAEKILKACGVRGGLVVHVGCGDGSLTAALHAADGYLVHGLDKESAHVDRAREHFQSLGLYGRVTADRLVNRHLPYADNVVNLVVSEDLGGIPMSEVMRVLCPGGVAYVNSGGQWSKSIKPRPGQLDQWTHFLYDATNNAVSHDTAVGLPYHIQWIGGPKWARSHDHLASISAAVSAAGRIFCIVDEGPTAAVALPPRWMLVARDAFNGVVLWKKPIGLWEGHLRGFRSGPAELPRRLVAVGDRVYVTLGYGKPLSCLDAATGRSIQTYDGTEGAVEIVWSDGVLFVVAGEMDLAEVARRRGAAPPPRERRLLALKADTGARVWEKADADTEELMPLTLAVGEDRVFFQNPDALVCLDARTGRERWRVSRPLRKDRWGWSTPTLVVSGDVVLSADRAGRDASQQAESPDEVQWDPSSRGGEAPRGELIAYSAQTGRELWRCECRETYNAPPDVLVAGGLVWTGDLVSARDPGITTARDPATGEIKMRRPKDQDFFSFGMGHHRCYRNKATDRYLLLGRSGVEFIDVATGEAIANHYVRGACQYGILAANGLLYAPSHSCACFIQAKLNGFNALAPKRAMERGARDERDQQPRLERGPAYSELSTLHSPLSTRQDWPTYRHDAARSGSTRQPVATNLKRTWETKLGGKLSPPVAAEGKIFVAAVDSHTVHAVDAAGGRRVWSYTAGGRVDSPPTIHRGLALFGSADGYVYCLRASDGALVWRFRAAPEDRRIVAYGQLESVWPVPGSVLVLEDGPGGSGQAAAYAVAGRTSYLDGGIYLYRLDPGTGRMLSQTRINNRDPQTDLPPQDEARGVDMPGGLPDVLSSDGEFVYMRHRRFDRKGVEQEPNVPHLFSPASFVDDSWWHRTYWVYGTKMNSGWGGWTTAGYQAPAGRLLVVDDSSVYGFGRLNQYARHGAHVGLPNPLLPWPPADNDNRGRGTTHYELFACSKTPELIDVSPGGKKPAAKPPAKKRRARPRDTTRIKPQWSEQVDVVARAMVLADETLFVAGPPELLALTAETSAQDLAAAEAAYEGKKGASLWAVSAEDGSKLAEYRLDSPPAFDGLIAAGGRLYLSTLDGRIVCMSER